VEERGGTPLTQGFERGHQAYGVLSTPGLNCTPDHVSNRCERLELIEGCVVGIEHASEMLVCIGVPSRGHRRETASELCHGQQVAESHMSHPGDCLLREGFGPIFLALHPSQQGHGDIAACDPVRLLGLNGKAVAFLGVAQCIAELANVDLIPGSANEQLRQQTQAALGSQPRTCALQQGERLAEVARGMCREAEDLRARGIGLVDGRSQLDTCRYLRPGIDRGRQGQDLERSWIEIVVSDFCDGFNDETSRSSPWVSPPASKGRALQEIERQVPVTLTGHVAGSDD